MAKKFRLAALLLTAMLLSGCGRIDIGEYYGVWRRTSEMIVLYPDNTWERTDEWGVRLECGSVETDGGQLRLLRGDGSLMTGLKARGGSLVTSEGAKLTYNGWSGLWYDRSVEDEPEYAVYFGLWTLSGNDGVTLLIDGTSWSIYRDGVYSAGEAGQLRPTFGGFMMTDGSLQPVGSMKLGGGRLTVTALDGASVEFLR
ncbi:MAG: hypothetical protein IJ493_01775 [Clostridia bacterium]|nr:hypothetical protein [Clostridia bacterium]